MYFFATWSTFNLKHKAYGKIKMYTRPARDMPSQFPVINHVETYMDYLERVPTQETKNGYRSYTLLCVAMRSVSEVVVVRKDPYVASSDPTDWFVLRDSVGKGVQKSPVLEARTRFNNNAGGDDIELLLAPTAAHHGPHTLRFNVTPDYKPTDEPIRLTHQKYYGRGVSSEANEYVDAVYDRPVRYDLGLAEVISIEVARIHKRNVALGSSAIAT